MLTANTNINTDTARFAASLPAYVWPLLSLLYAGVWLLFLQP